MNNNELDLKLHLLIDKDFADSYKERKTDRLWLSDVLPNYCNRWSELMPLVVEHNINHEGCKRDGFGAYKFRFNNKESDFYTNNKNLQRALAECLLKVLEEKQ